MNPLRNRAIQLALLGIFLVSCVLTVFYVYVNSTASKNLERALTQRKNAGRPTQWQEFVPPAIGNEDNFCNTPLLAALFDSSLSPQVTERGKKGPVEITSLDEVSTQLEKIKPNITFSNASYAKAERLDLKSWSKVFAKSDLFPAAPANSDDANAVLTALGLYQNTLAQIYEGTRKPDARFPVKYDTQTKSAISLPQLGACISLGKLTTLHAVAALQAGHPEMAWKDLQIVFKLHQAVIKEPFLISGLVDVTLMTGSLNVIWEGLADNMWSASDLQKISQTLGTLDHLQQYRKNLEGEFIFYMIPLIDDVKRNPGQMSNLSIDSSLVEVRWYFILTPSGWPCRPSKEQPKDLRKSRPILTWPVSRANSNSSVQRRVTIPKLSAK